MDETKQPWHKFREAITESTKLMSQDGHRALSLLDESISQAMRDGEPRWVLTLCHHAAIIARFVGDQQLVEHYYQQSLAFVPENPAALFGWPKFSESAVNSKLRGNT